MGQSHVTGPYNRIPPFPKGSDLALYVGTIPMDAERECRDHIRTSRRVRWWKHLQPGMDPCVCVGRVFGVSLGRVEKIARQQRRFPLDTNPDVYSQDFNPSRKLWSNLKQHLGRVKARAAEYYDKRSLRRCPPLRPTMHELGFPYGHPKANYKKDIVPFHCSIKLFRTPL